MRTVKYLDGQCSEACKEKNCPIAEELKRCRNNKTESANGENK